MNIKNHHIIRKHLSILLLIAVLSSVGINTHADTNNISDPHHKTLHKHDNSLFFTEPFIKLLGEYYSNSSDFKKESIGAEFGLAVNGGIHITTGYSFTDFSQDGFEDVTRNRVYLEGEKEVSEKVGIVARVSENLYDNENNNFNGSLYLRYRPQTNLYTEISFRHFDIIDYVLPFNNAIYSYVVTIGSIDRNIQSNDYKAYMMYFPDSRLSFAGEVTYGSYSDDNEKRSLMLEAGYKFNDSPYLRTAYNYFYLDIKNPAPITQGGNPNESAYWDPIKFDTHTLRLEFREDYLNSLTVGAEGALSYSFDSDGFSNTVILFVSYRFREHTSLRCDARWFNQDKGVDRIGKTGRFWAENYSIMLQNRF